MPDKTTYVLKIKLKMKTRLENNVYIYYSSNEEERHAFNVNVTLMILQNRILSMSLNTERFELLCDKFLLYSEHFLSVLTQNNQLNAVHGPQTPCEFHLWSMLFHFISHVDLNEFHPATTFLDKISTKIFTDHWNQFIKRFCLALSEMISQVNTYELKTLPVGH